jgi:hypothetical protein
VLSYRRGNNLVSKNIIIDAKITGITYTPLLCKDLPLYDEVDFVSALNSQTAFLLKVNENTVAVSRWVSPKRTRTYPYARVYNTLAFSGKKITIIPFMKDEGTDGDRDFIQWDTISLMSLLDVNVIIAYYYDAKKNNRYANKITEQLFDAGFIKNQIYELLSYQSSALHWNIRQIDSLKNTARISKQHYDKITQQTGVTMHSENTINRRIATLEKNKNNFMRISRDYSKSAQMREIQTIQPKEHITDGIKGQINITNYLGGTYYLTSDEAVVDGENVYIIEGKHTRSGKMPSLDDIKDGLLKMILYTNLKDVTIDKKHYNPVPILKLTRGDACRESEPVHCTKNQFSITLAEEARLNKFKLLLPRSE